MRDRANLHALITAERETVIAPRDAGQASHEILRRVERVLDLEEPRLDALVSGRRAHGPGPTTP